MTQRRRLMNAMWRALDEVLLPKLKHGALLCVSGGDDSMAMLECVARWPKRFEGVIEVASVDHGRPSAAKEVSLVCARAKVLGFSAHALHAHSHVKDENALRSLRFSLLEKCAKERNIGALVTAHHKSDRAESRLLSEFGRVAQGDFKSEARVGDFYRLKPFVSIARAELLSLPFAPFSFRDADDHRGASERGRFRRFCEEELTAFAPNFADSSADRAKREQALLDFALDEARLRLVFESEHRAQMVLPQNEVVLKAALRLVCSRFSQKRLRARASDELISLSQKSSGHLLLGKIEVEVRKNILFFSKMGVAER